MNLMMVVSRFDLDGIILHRSGVMCENLFQRVADRVQI